MVRGGNINKNRCFQKKEKKTLAFITLIVMIRGVFFFVLMYHTMARVLSCIRCTISGI